MVFNLNFINIMVKKFIRNDFLVKVQFDSFLAPMFHAPPIVLAVAVWSMQTESKTIANSKQIENELTY